MFSLITNWVLYKFDFLSLSTILVFELCCNFSFVTVRVFDLLQFEFLSFVIIWVLSFVTIWVMEFAHNLSLSFSQFGFCEILSFFLTLCHNFSFWALSQFEFCHNLTFFFNFCHSFNFWVFFLLTISVFEFCHNEVLSLVTFWVFEFGHD